MRVDRFSQQAFCPIWETNAWLAPHSGDYELVNSPRAGGIFRIDGSAEEIPKFKDNSLKAKLTSWLIEQRQIGVDEPKISPEIIDLVELRKSITFSKKIENFFRFIEQKDPKFNFSMNIIEAGESSGETLELSAAIESHGIDIHEIQAFLDLLEKLEYIRLNRSRITFFIEVKGWQYIENISKKRDSSDSAFVAMWFNTEIDNVFDTQIKIALEQCGYSGQFRVDRVEHTDKIDDLIIAKLNEASLVIVDLTFPIISEGSKLIPAYRGGVYFEAGYAMGLDIPIIWTCRKDNVEHIHFDIRQYNQIVWYKEEKNYYVGDGENKFSLQNALVNRITAIKKNRNIKQR